MGKASNLINKINENFEEVSINTFTEVEIEKALQEGLASLTEAEINAEVIEGEINEAKSSFPKAKQIKSLQALLKKYRADKKAKNTTLMSYRNDYAKASDRKAKLAITKKRKAKQAELDKIMNVISRANKQLDKLEQERKAYNKANRAKSKSAKKAA